METNVKLPTYNRKKFKQRLLSALLMHIFRWFRRLHFVHKFSVSHWYLFPPVLFLEGGLGMHIKEGPSLQQSYSNFLPLEDWWQKVWPHISESCWCKSIWQRYSESSGGYFSRYLFRWRELSFLMCLIRGDMQSTSIRYQR